MGGAAAGDDNVECRDTPLQKSRENLRYTFGQHVSIKIAYDSYYLLCLMFFLQ